MLHQFDLIGTPRISEPNVFIVQLRIINLITKDVVSAEFRSRMNVICF